MERDILMFSFKQFTAMLSEAELRNGVGERHTKKYITPYIGYKETHVLNSDHEGLGEGSRVSVHGTSVEGSGKNKQYYAIASSAGSRKRYKIPFGKIEKPTLKYSDEHAHVKIWNHMVNSGIANDKGAMSLELERAKKDKNHPLNFNRAEEKGFIGMKGKKTKLHEPSYYEQLSNAIDTVHALANHPHFRKAVQEKHAATVTGSSKKGQVSELWRSHNATEGTSKTDIAIVNPKSKAKGIRISLKGGSNSQLMSAGPEENAAVHDYATRQMLNQSPRYSGLSDAEKKRVHSEIMGHVEKANEVANTARNAPKSSMDRLKLEAQEHMNKIEKEHPALNPFLRREAATGEGKFGKDSPHTAAYIVKSSHGNRAPIVQPVDKINFQGPKIRVAKSKDPEKARTLNFKLDETK